MMNRKANCYSDYDLRTLFFQIPENWSYFYFFSWIADLELTLWSSENSARLRSLHLSLLSKEKISWFQRYLLPNTRDKHCPNTALWISNNFFIFAFIHHCHLDGVAQKINEVDFVDQCCFSLVPSLTLIKISIPRSFFFFFPNSLWHCGLLVWV